MSKLRELDEKYEEKINEAFPVDLNRSDLQPTTRLQGYCDAMYATVATFLVLPLRNLHDLDHHPKTLDEYLHDKRGHFACFFIGFFVICTLWEQKTRRFQIVKRLDDFLVFLDIISLLATTCLPFSMALAGHYLDEGAGSILTCILIAIIEFVEAIIVLYAFASPRLLHFELHNWSNTELSHLRNMLVLPRILGISICVAGGFLMLLHFALTWVLISLMIIVPLGRQMVFYVWRHKFSRNRTSTRKNSNANWFYWELSKGNISKERIECMSDAACAIIACVLILDLTVEHFPTVQKVKEHGLIYELKHMSPEIGVYAGCYGGVSALWYVNHTVVHHLNHFDTVLLFLQKVFLVFASLVPFTSNMIVKFGNHKDKQGSLANLTAFGFYFCAYSANALMVFWGYYKKEKLMHTWAVNRGIKGICGENRKGQLYVLLKVTLMPIWTLIGMILSSIPGGYGGHNLRFAMYGLTFLTFAILKLTLACHYHKSTDFTSRQASVRKWQKEVNETVGNPANDVQNTIVEEVTEVDATVLENLSTDAEVVMTESSAVKTSVQHDNDESKETNDYKF